jgi:selenocysteine lyase/cysteine desulfurase
VVCFRHLAGGLEAAELDAYQDRLQLALEASGEAWVSTTKIRGATYLRAGIVNYLSTEDDVDRMLEALRRLSAEAAGNSRT